MFLTATLSKNRAYVNEGVTLAIKFYRRVNPVDTPEYTPPTLTGFWVEELPVPVTQVKPTYPSIAQQAGVEGLVVVKALVGKNGRVLDVRLDDRRHVPLLNDVALAAARLWLFTPALANGKPVAVWTAIPFHFRLN